MRTKFRNRGQITLEIIIALGLITISIAAVILVVATSQSLSLDSTESNRATALAKRNFEIAKASATSNFAGLGSSSSTQNEFLEETIVQGLDNFTKQVTSRVSWRTDPSRLQKVELSTLLVNLQAAANVGGDTGGGGLTGDWRNPKTLGSIDLGPGNAATGLDVWNKIVYLSAVASDSKKPDFFVVNATNGQSPFIASSLDTGPGLNAVDVAGGYAYVANNSPTAQLQIIDVSNISSPVLVSSFELPGISGPNAVPMSIFYYGGRVYIGTLKVSGPEFHVVDVSNPAGPTELGSFDVGANVNSIYVSGSLAYLATSDDNQEVEILDVSNPAGITKVGSWNAPGAEDGESVYLSGNALYLGRKTGTDNEFFVLDVSNPAQISLLGSQKIGSDINGIRIRDYLAFLATSDSNNEFQVWNISNPGNIALWSSFNFPQVATGIDYENNIVYVSVRSNDALRIITSGP